MARQKEGKPLFYHADVLGLLSRPSYPRKRPLPDRPYAGGDRPKPAYHGRGGVAGLHAVACYAVPGAVEGWRGFSDYLLAVIAQIARMPYEDTEARRRVEFLNVISEEVIKLRNSLDNCEIELSISIYASLLRRHLQTLRIPYEGEPFGGNSGYGYPRNPQPRFPQRHFASR